MPAWIDTIQSRFANVYRTGCSSLLLILVLAAPAQAFLSLELSNGSRHRLRAHPVVLDLDRLPASYHRNGLQALNEEGNAVPLQVDDLNQDGTPDELAFLVDLPPRSTATYKLVKSGERETSRTPQGTELTIAKRGQNEEDGKYLDLQNSFWRTRIEIGKKKKLGIEVWDRSTGSSLIGRGMTRNGGDVWKKTGPRQTVVAKGPVRVIVEQTYPGIQKENFEGFRLTERYTLYARHPRLDFDWMIENPSDEKRTLRGMWGTMYRVWLGKLLSRNLPDTEILSVRHFLTSRKNLFYYNPETDHALGVVMHSPRWIQEIKPMWGGVPTVSGGVRIHASPSRRTARGNVAKAGKFGVGRIWPLKQGRLFRQRWDWKHAPHHFRFDPGERRSFSLTFNGYKGTQDKTRRAFERDVTLSVGTVNVMSGSEQPLRVARAPEWFAASFDDLNRWSTTKEANTRTDNGKVTLTTREPGAALYTAFTRDFDDPTAIRGRLETDENTTVRVSLVDLESDETYVLDRVTQDFNHTLLKDRGAYAEAAVDRGFVPSEEAYHKRLKNSGVVDGFGPYLELYGPRRCLLKLELMPRPDTANSGKPLRAVFHEVSVAWPLAPPPEITSPPENFDLTHIALGFNIRSRAVEQAERGYELQVARTPAFDDVQVDSYHVNRLRRGKKQSQPFQALGVHELLSRGEYVARVRSVAPHGRTGPWSDPYPITIASTATEPKPPARPVSPDRPLFIFTPKHKPAIYREMWDALPESIRRRSVAKEHMHRVMKRRDEWMKTARNTFPLFITPVHRTDAPPNLALFEHLMKTNPESIYGIWFAETGVQDEFAPRGLKLMARYGRVFGELGGGHRVHLQSGANKPLYDLLATHSEYLMHVVKTQNARAPTAGFAAAIGLWASGRMKHWGVETEWGMAKKSIGNNPDENPPRGIDWMPPFLVGLAYGAEVYNAQIIKYAAKWDGWNDDAGELDGIWDRVFGPFYRDLLRYDLIPSREEVMKNFRVALQPTKEQLRESAQKVRPFPRKNVAAALGSDGLGGEWVPNEPRWGIVPLLPPHATTSERDRFEEVADPERFETAGDVVTFLKNHYPPVKTEAFTVRSGDTGVITTGLDTYEQFERYPDRRTGPRTQHFHMNLTKGPVQSVRGKVSFHEYIILKQREDALFLHTNDYPDKPTRITLQLRDENSSVRVEPADALEKKQINEQSNRMRLHLSHRHPTSVARVFIERDEE